jgi:hypothetical protein
VGTPERQPLLPWRAERVRDDRGVAAPARTSPALVDPGVLAATQITGRGLSGAILVRVEQATCTLDESVESGHRCHRCPRVDAGQETRLGLVQIPHPRQVSLVEEGLADRSLPIAGQPPYRLVKVSVRTEQIWTEMAHHGCFSCGAQHLHDAQPETHADPVGRGQYQAYLETRSAPRTTNAIELP